MNSMNDGMTSLMHANNMSTSPFIQQPYQGFEYPQTPQMSHTLQPTTGITIMLNDLEQYCNEWELKRNINKQNTIFTIYDSILNIVQPFQYFGIYNKGPKSATYFRSAMHR